MEQVEVAEFRNITVAELPDLIAIGKAQLVVCGCTPVERSWHE